MSEHLVIAGTGRAGTSALVRFLGACGLPVGDATWFERARAGLEHRLAPGAPYVVKDPALGLYCDQVDMTSLHVDVLVLPVRDLEDATDSRLYVEHLRLADSHLTELSSDIVSLGTAGGALVSLHPLDVARTLAILEHRVLRWAARWDIPVVLLDFPRFTSDDDHLIGRLWPYIEPFSDRETARAAFAEVFDAAAVTINGGADDRDVVVRALSDRCKELRASVEWLQGERERLLAALGGAVEGPASGSS